MKNLSLVVLSLLSASLAARHLSAQTVTLNLRNTLDVARPSEVIELPLDTVMKTLHTTRDARYFASLADSHKTLLTQVFASQVNGPVDTLLLLVDLTPQQHLTVTLRAALPSDPQPQSRVQARNVPERKDDFAWENDVVAFRTYGPALEATGEISSGIDIWSKRVPTFITTTWYERDAESQRTHNPALSYHKDNGEGLDSYDVGPSRGCGGTAVFADGKIFPSNNFTAAHILADGPIRADFTLTYAPWTADGATVHETKRITLDAGSKLNHVRSFFTLDGKQSVTVAAGVAIHTGATVDHPDDGIVSVWDTPQLASAGRIGTALLLPAGKPQSVELPVQGKTFGNALFLFPINSGTTIDYFAGTAWSQAGTPSQPDFDAYLTATQTRLLHPVEVHWQSSASAK